MCYLLICNGNQLLSVSAVRAITSHGALTRTVVRLERETEVFSDGATAHPRQHNVLTTADVKASFDRDSVAQIYVLPKHYCFAFASFK